MTGNKVRSILAFLGDVAAFYIALFMVLLVRYGSDYTGAFSNHLLPFSIIMLPWMVVFYIAGLYEIKRLRNGIEFLQTFGVSLGLNMLIAISFFYLIPYFGITPKTNLFVFIAVFALIDFVWRRYFNAKTVSFQDKTRVLLVGASEITQELNDYISSNPQVGYEVVQWIHSEELPESMAKADSWKVRVKEDSIDLVVIPRHLAQDARFGRIFYELLYSGVQLGDIPSFYESVLQRIPLETISEEWFLEHLREHYRFYDDLKRGVEFIGALILQIIVLLPELLITVLIKTTSPGPVIYKQVRVGKNERNFTLYKFRSMRADAEKHGAQWSTTNDNRTTWIGKVLRHSHLDELPQLWNILRGEVSFVGPRPERPEFTAQLKEQVPFFEIRNLVKPGITGWAQINYRYGSTVEDSKHKLEYDIFYIKNRSIALDLSIILKTIKSFFIKLD